MKTKLLLVALLMSTTVMMSQDVMANQVNDFQDGTEQDWIIGNPASAVFPPTNIPDAGPTGTGDNMLEYTTVMPPSPPNAGTRMIIFNSSPQWTGSYSAQGIFSITMDVSVVTASLNLRVAFQGPGGTRICTKDPIFVAAGAGWTNIAIGIEPDDFEIVQVGGGTTIAGVLADVQTMRILSSPTPDWFGEVIDSTLRLDNITASTTLSNDNFSTLNEFSISPNPAISNLNVHLPNDAESAKISIFDVLGKRVYYGESNTLVSSINVSQWNSGVYLVRVSTDQATHTKRFVKQ